MKILRRSGGGGLLCAVLLALMTSRAVPDLIEPAEAFRLNIDVCRFRGGDDEHTNVEFYYAVVRRTLTFKTDSAGWSGAADLTLLIQKGDSLVHADRWLVPHAVADSSAIRSDVNLVGVYALQLREGEYTVRLLGRDAVRRERGDSIAFRLPISRFPADKPALSDVEFCTTVRQGKSGSQFYKNTLEVIPNVGGLYGETQRCFYYAEAYNLVVGGDRANYMLRSTVLDAVGREVMSRERPKKNIGESSVIVDQFGVDKMKSGTYTLAVSLLDTAGTLLATSGKKFFVYNQTLGVDSTLLSASASMPLTALMSLSEQELDREFDWSRYEGTDVEKAQYRELTGVDAKRKFLSDFWKRRPPGLRDEYLARVAYANSTFGSMQRDGFKADRGRVQIVYGTPDDIERHPSETESRPYEVWSYHNIQGGVIFVFVLRNQGGDYELVHSTHRNELHDPNWDRPGITR